MFSEASGFAVSTWNEPALDEIPEMLRRELNADTDRDLLLRMGHLARKKRMRQPDITEDEMADYLALAENCANFPQWLRSRRNPVLKPSRSTIAWIAAAVFAVAILTAVLTIAIAIAV